MTSPDILTPDQQAAGISDPGLGLAALPATLIVSGLEEQLSLVASGYSQTDYLAPLLSAAALLRERHAGDPDVLSEVRTSFGRILGRVVDAVGLDSGLDMSQLGIDPAGADYAGDVYELYRFFVVDRMRNAADLAYHTVTADRRRLVERYRRAVEKKNQTVAEARRVFQSFDDVVVWVCMPEIVEGLRAESAPAGTLAEALGALELEGAPFLRGVAWRFPDYAFLGRYLAPAVSGGRASSGLATALRARWLEDSPKKNAAIPAAEDQE